MRGSPTITRRELAAVVSIALLALLFRLAGTDHGLPFLSTFDEPRSLNIALRTARTGRLDPGAYHHPSFFFHVHAAALSLWAALFGGEGALQPVHVLAGSVAKARLTGAVEVARAVTAMFSVGSAVLIWALARSTTKHAGAALFALGLAVVAPSSVAFADHVNPNAMATFFVLGALLAALRLLSEDERRWYVLAGVATGLAAASRYDAAIVGLAPLAAHALREGRGGLRERRWLLVPGLAALSLAVAMPALIFEPSAVWKAIAHNAGPIGPRGAADPWLYLTWPWTHQPLATLLGLAGAAWALRERDLPLLLLGGFGLVGFVALHRSAGRDVASLGLLLPLLFVFAAVGARWLAEQLADRAGVASIVALAVGAAAVMVPFGHSLAWRADRDARLDLLAEAHDDLDVLLAKDASVYLGPQTPHLEARKRTLSKGRGELRPPRWFQDNKQVTHAVVASSSFQPYLDAPKAHPRRTRAARWLFSNFRTVDRWESGDHAIVLLERKPARQNKAKAGREPGRAKAGKNNGRGKAKAGKAKAGKGKRGKAGKGKRGKAGKAKAGKGQRRRGKGQKQRKRRRRAPKKAEG